MQYHRSLVQVLIQDPVHKILLNPLPILFWTPKSFTILLIFRVEPSALLVVNRPPFEPSTKMFLRAKVIMHYNNFVVFHKRYSYIQQTRQVNKSPGVLANYALRSA